jgi:hypothetical protein
MFDSVQIKLEDNGYLSDIINDIQFKEHLLWI